MQKISLALIILSFTGCIDFKISDEEAFSKFDGLEISPQFGDLIVGDQTIHYAFTDRSKDNLAIFVHGSPGSWSAFIDYFKADSLLQEIDMLSIDRPGFGMSNHGVAVSSMEKQAYYLNEVSRLFKHKNKILIGHSLGGPVIARMAMDYPNSYRGLVFVAASIDPEMEKDEWYRNVINTKLGGLLTPKDFEVSNDEILPLKVELEEMLPLWKKIQIPSIVIQGTEDSLVPKENADFAAKMLPEELIQMRMLEGVDHFIPWSHPEVIVDAIQELKRKSNKK
jgi:pimeloyl-ACP methyl ester carboxylesterase